MRFIINDVIIIELRNYEIYFKNYVKIVILQLLYSFQEDLFGMLGQYARMATAILSHISGNIIMAL